MQTHAEAPATLEWLDTESPAAMSQHRRRDWRAFRCWGQWVVATVAGGVVGMLLAVVVIPSILAVLFWRVPLDWIWAHPEVQPTLTALMLRNLLNLPFEDLWRVNTTHYIFWPYFGAVVGLGVGVAQSRVFKRYLPRCNRQLWLSVCAIGLSVGLLLFVPLQFQVLQGWTLYDLYRQGLDLVPDTLFYSVPYDLWDANNPLGLYAVLWRVVRAGLLGVTGGLVVGGLQWFALRRTVPRAILWIPISVASLHVGAVGLFLLYMISPPADSYGALVFWQATTYLIAGLAIIGGLTGAALVLLGQPLRPGTGRAGTDRSRGGFRHPGPPP